MWRSYELFCDIYLTKDNFFCALRSKTFPFRRNPPQKFFVRSSKRRKPPKCRGNASPTPHNDIHLSIRSLRLLLSPRAPKFSKCTLQENALTIRTGKSPQHLQKTPQQFDKTSLLLTESCVLFEVTPRSRSTDS